MYAREQASKFSTLFIHAKSSHQWFRENPNPLPSGAPPSYASLEDHSSYNNKGTDGNLYDSEQYRSARGATLQSNATLSPLPRPGGRPVFADEYTDIEDSSNNEYADISEKRLSQSYGNATYAMPLEGDQYENPTRSIGGGSVMNSAGYYEPASFRGSVAHASAAAPVLAPRRGQPVPPPVDHVYGFVSDIYEDSPTDTKDDTYEYDDGASISPVKMQKYLESCQNLWYSPSATRQEVNDNSCLCFTCCLFVC